MRVVLFAILMAILCTVQQGAIGASDSDPTRSKLHRTTLNVEWDDMSFREVFEHLSAMLNCAFVPTKAVEDRASETISLKLGGIRAISLIRILRDSFKVEFLQDGRVILVTSPEDAVKRTAVLRIYDVSSALYVPPDFPGPELGLRTGDDYDEEPPLLEERHEQRDIGEIVDLITRTSAPGTWDYEGVSIDTLGNRKVVVRHTPEVHRKIARLIRGIEGM